jgi:hypothetical protein
MRRVSSRASAMLAAAIALAIAIVAAAPGSARAQNVSLPGPHFGATMFPNLEAVQHVGLQFYDFTEFDKLQDASGLYRRYNDIDSTIGFNLITLSNTRNLRRDDPFASNLLLSSGVVAGYSFDQPTRALQNDVIHKLGGLPKVPRGATLKRPLLNYAAELNYNFHAIGRDADGRLQFIPTPLFVGAGFSAGTIMQDLYVQAGLHQFSSGRSYQRVLERFVFLSVSAMTRIGVTLPGLVIDETQLFYASGQGAVRLHFFSYSFPIVAEVALTGTTGVFRRGIGPEYGPYVAPAGPSPAIVDRVALPEYFVAFRLQLGDFIFETVNDFYGGKDRGPTYGAAVYYVLLPGSKLSWLVSWL